MTKDEQRAVALQANIDAIREAAAAHAAHECIYMESYKKALATYHAELARIAAEPDPLLKSLGQVAYEGFWPGMNASHYSDEAMKYWEAAAQAVVAEHERRKALEQGTSS